MAIFNKDSLCGDLVKELQARNACKEAINWINSVVTPKQSIDELLDAYLMDAKSPGTYSVWVLQNIYNLLTPDIRIRFISKIANEMTAFFLYLDCKDLNSEEEKLLTRVFKGKLPNAEKELTAGIVSRKKLCQ